MFRSFINRLPLGWSFRLAILRLAAQWQSLLTIVVGVLLAAVIGANTSLYTASIAQVGMIQRLDQQPAHEAHVFSRISLTSIDFPDIDAMWAASDLVVQDQVNEVFESTLPGWVGDTIGWAESAPMLVINEGADIDDIRMRVAYYESLSDYARLVDGAWPDADIPANIDMEVALPLSASISLGLVVGDELVLDQRGWDTSVPLRVLITAIVAEDKDTNAYWMSPSPLRTDGSGQWQLETNLLVSRDDFLRVAQDFVPQTRSQLGWRVLFDHTLMPYTSIPEANVLLMGFEQNMSQLFDAASGPELNFVYSTNLVSILTDYAFEVSLIGAPFALLLLQIGALVLFFLIATATLVRRGERRELAMLQSRGAFDRQLILLRGVEALLIAIGAMLAGPFVARQLLIWLAPLFTGLDRLPLEIDRSAFLFAGVAAVAAFFALMATLLPVLRLPLILAGGSASRAEKQSFYQRYYLDVVLAGVFGLAMWRLVTVDSPLTGTQIGGLEADPLMLMAPAVLFVSLGILLLRLFPLVMRILARFYASQSGLGGVLATWQVSRESVHYGRIVLLLTLAIGIGWFATSFRATVNRSHGDQARYAVGTDVRIVERDIVLNADRVRAVLDYLALDEVEAASPTLRFINPDVSNSRQNAIAGEVLAIDADTFGDVLYWRSDLGPVKAPRSPGEPVGLPEPGRDLPVLPDRIALWARIDVPSFSFSSNDLYQPDLDRLLNRMELYARMIDETGTYVHVLFEPVEVEWSRLGSDQPGLEMRSFNTTGWAYLEASLAMLDFVPEGDLRLDSIYWVHRARNTRQENDIRLSLADLTLVDAAGEITSLNWLAETGWEAVYDSGALIQDVSTGIGIAPDRPTVTARQIVWDQRGTRTAMGLVLDYPESGPIPAIASETLMAANGMQPGDNLTLINLGGVRPTLQVLDTSAYYPSLFEEERPFLVVDLDALLYTLNRRPSTSNYSAEMWVRLAPGVSAEDFSTAVDVQGDNTIVVKTETLDDVMRGLQTDPLALGLMGLLFLAFIVALVLSVVGLLTYAALTAQGRRGQFGVLRAMGLSLTRLVRSLALEQTLVVLTSATLGVLLGAILSANVVPTLAIGATGEAITPPFVVQVELGALLQYGGIMLLVLVSVLVTSLLLVRRLSLAQSLRLGEE